MDNSGKTPILSVPNRMPANGSDVFNYIARYGTSDYQIQMVLEMDDHLNEKRLLQAVKASIEAQPILGCRFVEDPQAPYWERRQDLHAITWFTVQEVEDEEKDAALQDWLSVLMDMDRDPMVLLRVLRSSTHDTLCVKMNHACSDGAGLVLYVRLLARLYGELSRDPAYRPEPNLAGREGRLFQEQGFFQDTDSAETDPPLDMPGPALPFVTGEPFARRQVIRRIPLSVWNEWIGAKEEGVTVNDIVLAAYMRALCQHMDRNDTLPVKVMVTMDLRRHLPERYAEMICNFSGVAYAQQSGQPPASFRQTVREMSDSMRRYKSGRDVMVSAVSLFDMFAGVGYESAVKILEQARVQGLQKGRSTPLISNFGRLDATPITFGNLEVADAYTVTPAYHVPGFMLGVNSYRDLMTFTISYFEPNTDSRLVEQLLDTLFEQFKTYGKA